MQLEVEEEPTAAPAAWRSEWPWVTVASAALYFSASDPSLGPSVALLWAIWRFTAIPGLPPAIPLALTYQWVQVVCGSWYITLTGRELPAFYVSGIDATIFIGLCTVATLTAGVAMGLRALGGMTGNARASSYDHIFTTRLLLGVYLFALLFEGTIQRFAFERPALQQALIAIQMGRYGILFLLVRRFVVPELHVVPIALLVGNELLLGFSGFFADFKEPLAVVMLVILEQFDRRKVRHWATLTAMCVLSVALATVWISVRGQYRADIQREDALSSRSARLERFIELASSWASLERETFLHDVDTLVDRMWVQYYPALAMRRVPSVLPHSNGDFLKAAVVHVLMPRIIYPDKPPLQSDSEKVRYYAGVWVAGEAEGTSIALGYMTEMYIDFGVPLMFVPILMYGAMLGAAFAFFRRMILVQQLAVPLLTVVCWLTLYVHEESTAKMLGDALTLLAYLGGMTFVIDRFVASGRLPVDPRYEATVHSWRSPLRQPAQAR